MSVFWQIAPIVVLLLGAVIVVWRGMVRKPDTSHNNARGGGSASYRG